MRLLPGALLVLFVLALPGAWAQEGVGQQTDERDITEGAGNETVPPGEEYIPPESSVPGEESIEGAPGWTYGLLVFAGSLVIAGAFAYVLIKQRPRH